MAQLPPPPAVCRLSVTDGSHLCLSTFWWSLLFLQLLPLPHPLLPADSLARLRV